MSGAEIKRYIDAEDGLARIRGNKKLYVKMLSMFLDSGEFDKFENNLIDGDVPAAADTMHAIKGLTGNLSMPKLYDLSSTLVEQLKKGGADDQLLNEFRAALTATRERVEELMTQIET